jgi:flagellar protein FlaI
VADTSPARGRWAFRPVPPEPRSIIELIQGGTLDSELAATLWLLVEAGVPLLVAGEGQGTGKTTLLGALLDFVAPETTIVELAGAAETFDWLPQASELGWPTRRRRARPDGLAGPPIRPDATLLFAAELSDHLPVYTWGAAARLAARAAVIGYGLAATIHADSLDEVFDQLRRPPVGLSDDELSHLGVVIVLRRIAGGRRRAVAAHYVRPVSRDAHGHVQRLGPAVLATWDPVADRLEHFGWGVIPELAVRVGRRAGDFELEAETRRALLDSLAGSDVVDGEAVRKAIAHHRTATAATTSISRPTPTNPPPAPAPH